MSFLKFVRPGASGPPADAETATVRKIVRELEQMPPQHAAFLAGFAYILARVAYADLHISDAETEEIERLVTQWGELSDAQAVLVVEIAKAQARHEGATEDYLVTRRFREVSTAEQREALLHCLFAVASAAGDTISAEESAEIRQIADEFGYTLPELNVIRRHYSDRLAALRGGAPGTT